MLDCMDDYTTILYRPEWTCGRYNREANVAIFYNLIGGMSYFFEDDSAEIVGWLLKQPRNAGFFVKTLSEETDTAMESLMPFLDDLVECGLLTNEAISKVGINTYREESSKRKCSQSLSLVKTAPQKRPIAISNAESEYMNRVGCITGVMFELTYNCSEKCIHCYNIGATRNDSEDSKRNNRKELTLSDYYRIIDELNEQGLVKVCLSGGDPFSNSFVWEIIDYLYKKEIAFDIFTNGQRLMGHTEKLAGYYPRLVGISIYSGEKAEHDYITRIKGSWNKSISVIRELSALAVPLNLKCCIMRPNVKHYYQVADLAKRYGAVAQFEVCLTDSIDGDKCVSRHLRLTPELLEIVLRDKNVPLYVGADALNFGGHPKPMDQNACGAGYNSFCITPEGNLIPCCSFHTVFGNLRQATFKQICNESEDLHLWQSLTLSQYKDCGKHKFCDYCNLCAGNNYSEHGNPTIAAENNCYVAKVRYELASKMKDGYDPLMGKSIADRLKELPDYNKEILKREYSQDYSDKSLMAGG